MHNLVLLARFAYSIVKYIMGGIYELRALSAQQNWTPVEADVQSVIVDPDGLGYAAQMQYEYFFEGRYLGGFLTRFCASKTEIKTFTHVFRSRSKTTVYLNPQNPEKSLVPTQMGVAGPLLAFGAVVLVTGAVVAFVWGYQWAWNPR
jgi:hypothetical protein